MNQPESNFKTLHQLLALKKHETPPPGYFNNFSSEVISRIRLGEAKEAPDALGKLFAEAPWMLRFLRMFEAKPAFAGVFASVMFLLLVTGIVYIDHPQAPADSLMPDQTAQTDQPVSTAQNGAAFASMSSSFLTPSSQQSDLVSSTNPVMSLEPIGTTFGSQNSLVQSAVFTH
jgi:hypothetical protein